MEINAKLCAYDIDETFKEYIKKKKTPVFLSKTKTNALLCF